MQTSDGATKLFLLVQRQAGVSRRKAQDLVSAGEVAVDGSAVTDPYRIVHPDAIRRITLRGHPLTVHPPELRVYRYYKPTGMLCSHDDPHEGNTVGRVLRAEGFIGYSWAGRLDQDAEGLLLITNDGDLSNLLSHPRYQVPKTYHVWLDRAMKRADFETILHAMTRGIDDDGDRLRILSGAVAGKPPYAVLRLTEGKKREIKRLFAHFDLSVIRLLRTAVGPVGLGGLRPGGLERLSESEIHAARDSASL